MKRSTNRRVSLRRRKGDFTENSNRDDSGRMKETLDVINDPDMMRQIRASERYFAKGGKGLSFEQVFSEPLQKPRKRAR